MVAEMPTKKPVPEPRRRGRPAGEPGLEAFTIRVRPELRRALGMAAQAEGRSTNTLIAEILAVWWQAPGRAPLRRAYEAATRGRKQG